MSEKKVRDLNPKTQAVLELKVGETFFCVDGTVRVAQWLLTIQKRYPTRKFTTKKYVAVDSVTCSAEPVTKIIRLKDDSGPAQ